ncbi:neuropilin-2 isoform X2 [Nematostella vectensis]|uniref:neuropilin-2 isoform X2 n=1 Tax=Nematostella vectensis TaxID=45351 RepID=UPI0020776343|nr:neuropilin-2 isoform X2 [Nematostella vectensis]
MKWTKRSWIFALLLLVIVRSTNGACSGTLGMTSGDIADSQITASSTFSDFTKPEAARLRNTGSIEQLTFGGWCAKDGDTEPYLQIDFARETVLRVIATQGLEQPSGNWVTRYAVNYSCDGKTWREYKEENKRKIFSGNDDAQSIVRNALRVPIIARLIRVLPLDKKQHGLACMRLEMYGCYEEEAAGFTECNIAVGMEDGRIPSAQITASSFTGDHVAHSGRLNQLTKSNNGSVTWGAWCTDLLDDKQYLQVDLGQVRNISGVATQGYSRGGWVTEYIIRYSMDGKDWDIYRENNTDEALVFDGNWDTDTVTGQRFQRVFSARFVQFNPVTWNTPGSICMRVELYECVKYSGCTSETSSSYTPTSHQPQEHSSLRPTARATTPTTRYRGVLVRAADDSAATTHALGSIWACSVLLIAFVLLV